MNEEIEYAQMLEIPVSTVSVVHKKKKKSKKSPMEKSTRRDMKRSLISQVNDRLETEESQRISAEAELFAESANSDGRLDFGDIPQRVDTVRLYSANDKIFPETDDFLEEEADFAIEEEENEVGRYENNLTKSERRVRAVLGVEFAVCCALCGAIFLTNVLIPNSAVNGFFRSLGQKPAQIETDKRAYTDFTLSPVVSGLTDAELSLSSTGVLSVGGECLIYPATDGKISEIIAKTDGGYTVKISYSDTFTGVFDGLDYVYYEVGEKVKANVPIGYLGEEATAQLTMYSSGQLLSCFELTDENCLAWIEQE